MKTNPFCYFVPYLLVLSCNMNFVFCCCKTEAYQYTFHSEELNWNEAHRNCQRNNRNLLNLKTAKQQRTLIEITTLWVQNNHIKDKYWIGGFSYMNTSIPVLNGWYWDDCTAITEPSHWQQFTNDKKCVYKEKDRETWFTEMCKRPFPYICQIKIGDCWFEDRKGEKLIDDAISNQVVINISPRSIDDCKKYCQDYDDPEEDCTSFTNKENECLIILGPYTSGTFLPIMEKVQSYTTFIKRCYVANTDADAAINDVRGFESQLNPEPLCQPTPTPTTTPAVTTTTPTTSSPETTAAADTTGIAESTIVYTTTTVESNTELNTEDTATSFGSTAVDAKTSVESTTTDTRGATESTTVDTTFYQWTTKDVIATVEATTTAKTTTVETTTSATSTTVEAATSVESTTVEAMTTPESTTVEATTEPSVKSTTTDTPGAAESTTVDTFFQWTTIDTIPTVAIPNTVEATTPAKSTTVEVRTIAEEATTNAESITLEATTSVESITLEATTSTESITVGATTLAESNTVEATTSAESTTLDTITTADLTIANSRLSAESTIEDITTSAESAIVDTTTDFRSTSLDIPTPVASTIADTSTTVNSTTAPDTTAETQTTVSLISDDTETTVKSTSYGTTTPSESQGNTDSQPTSNILTVNNDTQSTSSNLPPEPHSNQTAGISGIGRFGRPLCGCRCKRNGSRLRLENIISYLTIDEKVLSANVRRKISISDERPSAVGLGVLGITLLVATVSLFIISDTTRFIFNRGFH